MKTYAPALAQEIEDLLTAAGLTVDRVTATAGEPAAPSGQCQAVWVWLSEVFDTAQVFQRRGDERGCLHRTALRLSIRIDSCYTERDDGADQTDSEHLTDHDTFVDLIDTIYAGLVGRWAAGTLLGLDSCQAGKVGDVSIGARQGGIVSASMYVEAEYDIG